MAVTVSPLAQAVAARVAGAEAPVFTPGQLLEALVLGKLPDGLTMLRIGDFAVSARLPQTLPPGATLDLTTQVGAPFGSDFLVAVETEAPSDALALLLSDPERLWDARSLWEALQMAEMEGAAPRVAVFPFHSRGE